MFKRYLIHLKLFLLTVIVAGGGFGILWSMQNGVKEGLIAGTFFGVIMGVFAMFFGGVGSIRESQRRRESITCACGALAQPIDMTRDRYRCAGCKMQFAGPKHSF
jgi:hypothetical protein